MAKGKIRGVTIELGADNSQFMSSLKDIDKSLKTTQSQLKDVNKLLKLDPKNTELLRQKQDLLKNSVADTKKRLDELKQAQKTMDQNGIDRNSDQYKALQREIIATEQALDDAKSAAKDFSSVMGEKMKVVGGNIKDVGSKISSVGSTMTKTVTGPIVAGAAAATAAWAEVDNGLDIIVTKTGASGEALEDLQDRAKNLATTIPTSFETAGTAIGEVNTRFGLTGEALEDLSGQFIKFAELNDTDVNSSIDQVQKTLAAFNLGTEDAAGLLDILNGVGQATGISMDTLASSMQANAAALQEMGLSAGESAVLLGNIETSGIDVSTAMTGLKKAMSNASADGKTLSEAMVEFNEVMESSASDSEKLAEAYDLFGKSAGAAFYTAYENGTFALDELGTSLDTFGGSVSETFAATQDPLDGVTTTMNEMKLIGADLVETAGPAITAALGAIRDVVQTLREKWEGLNPQTQEAIVKFVGIAAAIGPVITVVGSLVSGIGTLIGAFGAMMTPVGAVIAVIGALVAAGTALYLNWDTVKAKCREFSENLQSSIGTMANNVRDKFQSFMNKATELKNAIFEKFNAIKEKVMGVVEKIKGAFNFKWELPKLKMPHFSVSGSLNPIDWITKGVPRFSVEWYKKAMHQPYILDGATIFGAMGGKLLGGGEAGREVVMSEAMLKGIGNQTINNYITVNNAQGMDEERLARRISEIQAQQEKRRRFSYGY